MNPDYQVKTITRLKKHKAALLLFVMFLSLANLTLSIRVLFQDKAIVIVPTHVSNEFEISNKSMSKEYLELMSRDFIQSFLDMTPENFDYIKEYLLKLAHPQYLGELKQQLSELYEEIRAKQISLQFIILDMDINQDALSVNINGYLIKYMGNRQVDKQLKKYHIAFGNNGTRLMLKEFYEVADAQENLN